MRLGLEAEAGGGWMRLGLVWSIGTHHSLTWDVITEGEFLAPEACASHAVSSG